MAASPEKRCLYEILGLNLDCTADEIRSAYKKLALQRHPDKLMRSGLSQEDATASFQELVNAYEVLSDPRERAWYDSHRSQILFSSSNNASSVTSIPNLFSFFSNSVFSGFSDSGKGFYKVYGDVFDRIYNNEVNFTRRMGVGEVKEAPVLGNLKSPYTQVNAFYGYWLGFVTVMDFVWVDEYDSKVGENRKVRRLMEEENKKLRRKAKREYNETVRGLAAFAKKRDKRVIDMVVKRNEEMEKRKEEERERKKEAERVRAERVRAYKEPEWASVEVEVEEVEEVVEESERKNELYCVACGKKFKSEKQWRNHEQSKKHKEKVAELREAFEYEERMNGNGKVEEEKEDEVEEDETEGNGFVSADDGTDDGADDLTERFGNGFSVLEEEGSGGDDDEQEGESNGEVFVDTDNGGNLKGNSEKLGMDDNDDEASMLEAMVSGHKSKKNKKGKSKASEVHVETDSDENEFMDYNNCKGTRRNKGSRRRKGRKADEDATKGDAAEITRQAVEEDFSTSSKSNRSNEVTEAESLKVSSQSEEKNVQVDSLVAEETKSHSSAGTGTKSLEKDRKGLKAVAQKIVADKKDINSKSKNASKGKKNKASSKASDNNVCERCGEDFGSRTKLHKHLGETGHATLKSR
ncbi:DnaJ subfamily member [Heracleum sosnowskyi]|uniref:DnaJ subfamily member n=1 Tax=Heracleum sosnowskyi TaxID=360622 RepID=A0AAD8HS00_9APIA|nr:DnaJ subfamily member [Heracleum sosnowskyi]